MEHGRRFSMRAVCVMGVVGMWLVGANSWAEARVMLPPTQPIPWVIESADYTGKVVDRIAKLQSVLSIEVLQDGWVQVPLTLNGATITKVELIKKAGEAHVAPDPATTGQYVLMASRKGAYKVKIEFSIRLYQDSQYEGVIVGIPQASFSTLSLTVPRKDVELRESDQLYVERHPDGKVGGVTLKASLASVQQLDVRWMTKPTAPVKLEPMVYGEVATLAMLQEQLARITAIVDYRVSQGDVKSFTVHLPKGVQVLNVRGAGIDDWRVKESEDHQVLDVALNFTLKDTTYRLLIEGEQTLQAKQPTYQVPEFTLIGIKQERGQLAIAAEGNLETTAGMMDGLTRIDVKEVSDTLRSSTTVPIILAFRYHQHPYNATVTLTHYEDLPVLNAIAEQGNLVTVLSREGQRLTRAVYAVRANKKQFLGVFLPEGATLWSCLVDSRSVKPVNGTKQELLVPLASSKGAEQIVVVELVYFEQQHVLEGVGQLQLQGPTLDIPTTIANWVVYAPAQMKWLRTAGNLERGLSPVAFLDDPVFQTVAYADELRETGERRSFNGAAGAMMEKLADGTKSMKRTFAKSRLAQSEWHGGEPSAAAPEEEKFDQRNDKDNVASNMEALMSQRQQDAGILPLKIRIPRAGHTHQFSRLMTSGEALMLRTTYVNLPDWLPFLLGFMGGVGMLGLGAIGFARLRKS